MGVSVEYHTEEDGLLYVFALNGVGDKYTTVYVNQDDVYKLKCILLPTNDWGADPFQESLEVRDEAQLYIEENLETEVDNGCMTYNQFIPLEYWDDVGVDHELVESVELELDGSREE